MSEYWSYDKETGKDIHVFEFEDSINSIKKRYYDSQARVEFLQNRVRELEDANWKDKELQDMKNKMEEMKKDIWRGFSISEKEEEAIEKWKKEHEAKVHMLTTPQLRMKAGGVSGGRYTYKFYPTGLGTSGIIRCNCGAEFEFQKLG